MSAARDEAPDQRGVLEEEVRGEQGAGPAREPDPTKSWLAGRPDLGTRVGAEAFAEDPAEAAVGWALRFFNHEKYERHEKGKDDGWRLSGSSAVRAFRVFHGSKIWRLTAPIARRLRSSVACSPRCEPDGIDEEHDVYCSFSAFLHI